MKGSVTDISPGLRKALSSRYPIERALGEGGMASVFLARDRRHDRLVALKVLRPEVAMLLGRERFERETRVAASLNHPGIVPVHDSGEAAGFLYYVMPALDGGSLRDRLTRERQLPVPETARILGEVADALAYAHRRGLVHRDIKPENILFHEGRALVADFGIALALNQVDSDRLTETGLSVGTPAYMSPEQAAGQRELDPRSDQYSLACVAYEMLAGDPPFTASSPRALLARQITDPAPSLDPVRPGLPGGVTSAVMRALAKVPADRFEDVRAFSGEFARGLSSPAMPGRTGTGRKVSWRVAGVGLAAAAAVAAGLWIGLRPQTPIRSLAVLPPTTFDGDTTRAYLVEGIQDQLITMLAQDSRLRIKPRTATSAMWDSTHSHRRVAAGLGVDALLETSLLPTADSLLLSVQLIDGAREEVMWAVRFPSSRRDILITVGRIADSLGRRLGTPSPARGGRPARQVDPVAYDLVLRADHSHFLWTDESISHARDLYQQAIDQDPTYADAWAGLASSMTDMALFGVAAARPIRTPAVAAARRALALDSTSGKAEAAVAVAEFWLGWKADTALHHCERAIARRPTDAVIRHACSSILTLTGQFDAGIAQMERALELDPVRGELSVNLGWTYMMAGRYREAIAALRTTLAAYPSMTTWAMVHMSNSYAALDSAAQAGALAAEALRRAPHEFTYGTAAVVFARIGRVAEARRALAELERLADSSVVDPYNLFGPYAWLGEDERALGFLERVADEGWPSLMFLAVDPFVPDRLRQHPRVRRLLTLAQGLDAAGPK